MKRIMILTLCLGLFGFANPHTAGEPFPQQTELTEDTQENVQ